MGTHIHGSYGNWTDSRLVSPTTTLPSVAGVGVEEVHLRFMNWFNYGAMDYGQVQVQVWDAAGAAWGAWGNVGASVSSHYSDWSLKDVDLTAYAGETVRIAFFHVATRQYSNVADESTGWYIDDISILFIPGP